MISRSLPALSGAILLALFLPSFLSAQNVASARKQTEKPPSLKLYYLKNVEAQTAGDVLQTLLAGEPELRLTVDPRTNSIIVLGNYDQHEKVAAALKELDGKDGTEIRMVPIHENLMDRQQLIQAMMGSRVAMAFDADSKVLVLRGHRDDIDTAVKFLEALDGAVEQDNNKTQMIRIVWLVAGKMAADLPAPGDDLADVVKELKLVNMSNVRIAAQYLLQASKDSPFQAESEVALDDMYTVLIQGTLSEPAPGEAFVELQLQVQTENRSASEIGTKIRSPQGHFVVLGAAPMCGIQSAIVVQRIEK